MTGLWEKLRHTIRNGRARFSQLRGSFSVDQQCINDSIEITETDDDDTDTTSTQNGHASNDEEEITNPLNDRLIPGICFACKLAVQRYYSDTNNRSFGNVDSPLLTHTSCSTSTSRAQRRNSCPFCGLSYSELSERRRSVRQLLTDLGGTQPPQRTFNENPINSSSLAQSGANSSASTSLGRQQRSLSDPEHRLPPIMNYPHPDCRNECTEERNSTRLFRRLDDLNLLLPSQPHVSIMLPPINKDSNKKPFEYFEMSTCDCEFLNKTSFAPKQEDAGSETVQKINSVAAHAIRFRTRQEFLQDVRRAQSKDNFGSLQKFYTNLFSSFTELCKLFKTICTAEELNVKSEDPNLNMEFVYSVYDALEEMPNQIHKAVLKSIVNSLLEETETLEENDELRSVFILLMCPIFTAKSSYVVFAHLMRFCVNMKSREHRVLVGWFKTLEVDRLRSIVRNVMQFITIRQFSSGEKTLPPRSRTKWWIPTATKLLALINVANNGSNPPLLHYSELYNSSLDHIDLMQDYYVWQNCKHPAQFAYCQYPFILSILAKRLILTKDSEQQMIVNARRSLVSKMGRHQAPQIDIFFLNINVRRNNIVSDSLNEITCKQKDLKKKLKVSFIGEPGLDMGGLTKEWFLLLIREIFHSDYSMFVYHHRSRCYWFSLDNKYSSYREYNLIGVLMGLAVYNSNILDLHFPSVCYRKLLSPVVVPHTDESNIIGVIRSPTVEDLAEIMPDVAKSLSDLLRYEGNVEDDFCLNFQVSVEEFDEIKTFELIEGGAEIPVTNESRTNYVDRYLDLILNSAVYNQFKAFYFGFHSVCASNALTMLRGEEVEMLVCGLDHLNVQELQKITEYDGFDPDEEFILEFWEIIKSFSEDMQKKFLLFTTGSDRIPIGGVSEMTFKITRLPIKLENLPEAHTCFNQLVIPRYESKSILKEKLITAIFNAEGFGLE